MCLHGRCVHYRMSSITTHLALQEDSVEPIRVVRHCLVILHDEYPASEITNSRARAMNVVAAIVLIWKGVVTSPADCFGEHTNQINMGQPWYTTIAEICPQSLGSSVIALQAGDVRIAHFLVKP
jgi:hypothetical protein